MFGDMDPETMFTFLTRDGLAAMLSFLTTQMSAKQGLKQFGQARADAIMSELEQLVYQKVT